MLKILAGKTNNTLVQLLRYAIVGGSATAITFILLYTLTEYAGIQYLISTAIAMTIALTYNYILSILWVFDKRAYNSKFIEIAIFCIIAITGLGLNELFVWTLTEQAELHYMTSQVFAAGAVYLWNFLARKTILFR